MSSVIAESRLRTPKTIWTSLKVSAGDLGRNISILYFKIATIQYTLLAKSTVHAKLNDCTVVKFLMQRCRVSKSKTQASHFQEWNLVYGSHARFPSRPTPNLADRRRLENGRTS